MNARVPECLYDPLISSDPETSRIFVFKQPEELYSDVGDVTQCTFEHSDPVRDDKDATEVWETRMKVGDPNFVKETNDIDIHLEGSSETERNDVTMLDTQYGSVDVISGYSSRQ